MGIDKFHRRGVFPALSVGGIEFFGGAYPIAGKTYFVSSKGNNSNGLNWKNAFTTLEAAIAANNTDIGAEGGVNWWKRNRMYIDGGNYTDVLTALPNHCDMIGVGAAPARINANTNISVTVSCCRMYNMYFRSTAAGTPILRISGSNCTGIEFHGCQFQTSALPTIGLQLGTGTLSFKVNGCKFSGNPVMPIGIQIDGPNSCISEITNNIIFATTKGISIAHGTNADYQLLIKDNVICRSDPNSDDPLTVGIDFLDTEGRSKAMVINNYIAAADGINFVGTYANHRDHWMCIGNIINKNAGSTHETVITGA